MIIVGLGGLLTDAACAVMRDGELVAAVEERKISRRHAAGALPEQALAACLEMAKASAADVDCIALARPFSFGRGNKIHLELRTRFPKARVVVVEHHAAHAASAFYPSPFSEAVVLTLDRSGDYRCGARWRAHGNDLFMEEELFSPDSLGELYGRVTEFLGFAASADEHKVQWLSAAGDDRFVPLFDDILGQGSWPRLDRRYFDGDRLSHGGFSSLFYERLGLEDGSPVPDKSKAHVAAGLQRALEKAVLRMAGEGAPVCLAGGLAMNVLLISALEREREVFVQPAGGNAGTAIGAVYYAWHSTLHQTRRSTLGNLCLGPAYGAEEIKKVLENCKLRFRYLLTTDELIEQAVQRLNERRIIGWMQGRMEFGPRALGNRSILASPLDPYSTENLNIFIKHREHFRKFAASVPAERAGEFFEVGPNARFLATVGRARPEHEATFAGALLGAGDHHIRVHVVHEADNPLYHRLLTEAGKATGLPVLYNTSYNLFGDPLVCSPRDAVRSFYSSGIDAVFVGHFLLEK